MTHNKTCIIQCKKCGLLTRHERQRWERRFFPLLLFGRTETV